MLYFFNIRDHGKLIPDEEGSKLSGIVAPRVEAWASARDFAIDDLRSGRMIDERLIEITNPAGTVLESVAVRDILMSRAH